MADNGAHPQLQIDPVGKSLKVYLPVFPEDPGCIADDLVFGDTMLQHDLIVAPEGQALVSHFLHPVKHEATIGTLVKQNIQLPGRAVQTVQGNRIPALSDQGQHTGTVGIEPELPVRSKNFPDQFLVIRKMNGIRQVHPPLSG